MARQLFGKFADLDAVAVRGTPERVADDLKVKREHGVGLFTLMFGDLAPPETIRLFGEQVLPQLA
jgi:alkanesulfonate monooxygenase SsuD/methylene tetrahydromethanopterin reductase-like flavin-dependent oxidoreductase (luciferase family)